ncbi:MGDG synthase family glycosyltransferase [Paenibacillus sp. strain BS8-2]
MFYVSNSPQPKLLILYASYGEGHVQAARALQSALERLGNNRTVLCDLMAESHPWLSGMTRRFYQSSYTHMPYLYGWMYDVTKPMKPNSLFGSWLHSFGRHKIRQVLMEERPDAVIYTFPLYGMPPAFKREQLSRTIPSYAVITDFDLHRRWVHPYIDRYYVATEDLSNELRALGIPAQSVLTSGIPLKPGFQQTAATRELYDHYGIDPAKKVVLIMTGAQGVMPDVPHLIDRLLQHSDLQLAVVCGKNQRLREELKDQFPEQRTNGQLHIFGYLHAIHELMSISDCLVTKPGGITLAEAIATGLPTFVYRPVPGQEKQNALYLASKGAAFIKKDAAALAAAVQELLSSPQKLELCRTNIRQLQISSASAPNSHGNYSIYAGGSAAESIILDIISNIGIMKRTSIF